MCGASLKEAEEASGQSEEVVEPSRIRQRTVSVPPDEVASAREQVSTQADTVRGVDDEEPPLRMEDFEAGAPVSASASPQREAAVEVATVDVPEEPSVQTFAQDNGHQAGDSADSQDAFVAPVRSVVDELWDDDSAEDASEDSSDDEEFGDDSLDTADAEQDDTAQDETAPKKRRRRRRRRKKKSEEESTELGAADEQQSQDEAQVDPPQEVVEAAAVPTETQAVEQDVSEVVEEKDHVAPESERVIEEDTAVVRVEHASEDGALVGWLVYYGDRESGVATEIRAGRFFVTRERIKPTDMVIEHESLSTPHALIQASEEEGIRVQDLMSEHGTFVQREGGKGFSQESATVDLRHGDVLRLGEYEVLVCLVKSGVKK